MCTYTCAYAFEIDCYTVLIGGQMPTVKDTAKVSTRRGITADKQRLDAGRQYGKSLQDCYKTVQLVFL